MNGYGLGGNGVSAARHRAIRDKQCKVARLERDIDAFKRHGYANLAEALIRELGELKATPLPA